MQISKRSLALAAVLAALAVPVAHAREDMDAHVFVKMAKSSKDGMVSKAEVIKQVEKMFDKHDTKKEGKLDRKQLELFLQELMKSGA